MYRRRSGAARWASDEHAWCTSVALSAGRASSGQASGGLGRDDAAGTRWALDHAVRADPPVRDLMARPIVRVLSRPLTSRHHSLWTPRSSPASISPCLLYAILSQSCRRSDHRARQNSGERLCSFIRGSYVCHRALVADNQTSFHVLAPVRGTGSLMQSATDRVQMVQCSTSRCPSGVSPPGHPRFGPHFT